MKNTWKLIIVLVCSVVLLNCSKGIDPISKVDPGEDTTAPTVSIAYPNSDVLIPFTETKTSLNFEFEINDDIEIGEVSISLNGQELEKYSSFNDYRIFKSSYLYEDLPVGDYVFAVHTNDKSGKITKEAVAFTVTNEYRAKYDGEVFYMPFENNLTDLISKEDATAEGSPSFGVGKSGKSYYGASDSYLTFPTKGLLEEDFSASFWYNVNADPDRAGILVVGPPDIANPESQNDRTKGFRFFRENAEGKQRFKLNVGSGASDTWLDGGSAADVAPGSGWVHMAFTISASKAVVYIDGEIAKEVEFDGVDWTGCDILSIGSGAPRFTEWGHLSDLSGMDELRLFNKALTQQQVQEIKNGAGL